MLKKIAKAGALFFAVGLTLALVAPPLAAMLGPSLLGEAVVAQAAATPILWTGAFFGAFGAINAALEPVFDKIFGKKMPAPHQALPEKVAAKSADLSGHAAVPEKEFNHCQALKSREQADAIQRSPGS